MENYCKECDRSHEKPNGSASPRLHYNQPTMYDHLPVYQKFKEHKEKEKFMKLRREELLSFDETFTNLHLESNTGCNKDVFDNFSTNDIAKFRQGIKGTDPVKNNTDAIPSVVEENGIPLKKTPSLLTISRTPVQCPVSRCGRTIGVTSVLSHYLRDHNEDLCVQCQEIYGDGRSLLVFDPSQFEFRENICLGILAYGGINKEGCNRPASRGFCMPNAFLSKPHESLDGHLPILIMICKTSLSAMLLDKKLEQQITNPLDEKQHLLVIWLVSVQTTKPIYCTVTTFDKAMTASRSTIAQVRHLNDPQNPSDFLMSDTNYLRLNRGEINILSKHGTENIHVEIMINDLMQN